MSSDESRLETFEWLLGDDGQELLSQVEAGDRSLSAASSLRARFQAEQVSLAFSIAELRDKGRAKFGSAARHMYFTREALEQATRLPVARHRAGRIAAAAPDSVIDLGCGIGGDLVALAEAGLTTAGVDLDPLRVAMARANLVALGLPGAVSVADATTLDLSPFGVRFADPARRTGAGRSFRPDAWLPSWEFVSDLLTRASCVKVAPGIPHAMVPAGVEAEWVSDHGELKEAVLWSGPLATVVRRATVIGNGGLATLTDEDDPGGIDAGPVLGLLYEPDDAVIRAGLVTAVAAGVGGRLIDPKIAWVTSEHAFTTPFARGYRVLEEVPFREKALKQALRQRGIGSLTIKKRGVQVVPEHLRARLSLRGDEAATLVLTRVQGRGVALLVEPF